jgi:hypothetical protein
MRFGKKAQFYLLTAIVLIGFSTLLLHSSEVTPLGSKNLQKVFSNFEFESSAAINNALFEKKDVNDEYERFLTLFISYSKMKKLDMELFSILATGDRVYFSNKMVNSVRIVNLNETISPGSNTYFLRSNLSEVVLEVRDDVFHENIYKYNIPDEGTEAKAVLRVGIGANRQIFVMD